MNLGHTRAIVIAGLLLGCCACSTLNSIDNISPGSPQYFTGTRLNIAAICNDETTLEWFADYSMRPVEYPALDLPLSLVMDAAYIGTQLYLPGH